MMMDSSREQRQRDVGGDQPGHDQVIHRMGGQVAERVNLLGHAHGADFGGNGRADAPGHHQARSAPGRVRCTWRPRRRRAWRCPS